MADIIGFGEDGVYVAKSLGGTFGNVSRWVDNFGTNYGWEQPLHIKSYVDDRERHRIRTSLDEDLRAHFELGVQLGFAEAQATANEPSQQGWRDIAWRGLYHASEILVDHFDDFNSGLLDNALSNVRVADQSRAYELIQAVRLDVRRMVEKNWSPRRQHSRFDNS